jgi:C4-type Zn-finger protein
MVPETPTPPVDQSSNDAIMKEIKQVLDDLRKDGKIVTIQICPQCKSPKLRSRDPRYDIGGAMGITPPKYLCTRCGYWGRVVIEVTHADVDETVLDEILNADIESAQKLLNDLHQEHPTNEKD